MQPILSKLEPSSAACCGRLTPGAPVALLELGCDGATTAHTLRQCMQHTHEIGFFLFSSMVFGSIPVSFFLWPR